MDIRINHHGVPAIKFRALGTHYPTGNYQEAYMEAFQRMSYWFELHIDGLEITWFANYDYTREEEE